MNESVITVNFDVESEAYQALSEIKRHPDGSGYFVSAASLIKKENGHIVLKDGFDTGIDTADDAAYGSLIGSLVGILGGPLGVLFGGSMGALVGSTVDADDAMQSASLIEQVCTDIRDGGTALIALVQEDDDMRFERAFDPFKVEIIRHDAAEVAEEVEKAQALERKMAREARAKLRAEKKAEWNAMVENKRQEIRQFFDRLRQKK